MNLDEFKNIFFMEWGHRVLGRLVGLAVVLPFGYFLARGKLPRPLPGMIGGFIALVGAQGAMGWYMVKSGLHEDLFADGAHPRVSQYRLAAHLGLALVLYAGMFHAGLRILWDNKLAQFGKFAGMSAERAVVGLKALQSPPIAAFRRNVFILSGMVLLTAVSGEGRLRIYVGKISLCCRRLRRWAGCWSGLQSIPIHGDRPHATS